MAKRKSYHDGDAVVNFGDFRFQRDLRKAKLPTFPNQRDLRTSADEALWMLWVMRDYFGHWSPMYAEEIVELLELRGIGAEANQIEKDFSKRNKWVIRRQFDTDDPKLAYVISDKGIAHLEKKYATTGVRTIVIDGSRPWYDRHFTLAKLAAAMSGHIRIVDRYYGRGTLALLYHFRHGCPLQFLTGKTSENRGVFLRELSDFQKEVRHLQVRFFPNQHELHDRYIIGDQTLIIVGHGIKDIGNKESFLIILKGRSTKELRSTLRLKFEERWGQSVQPAPSF